MPAAKSPLLPPPVGLPRPTPADALFALVLIAAGFCFWEWGLLFSGARGVGSTLFFLVLIISTFIYLQVRGVRQSGKSFLLLAIALAGALPYTLYGARDINWLILLFEMGACLLWVAYSCRTQLSTRLTAILPFDLFNQSLIVPFANFGRILTRSLGLLGKSRIWRPLLIGLAGLLIGLPVVAFVLGLLALSDIGFQSLLTTITDALNLEQIATWVFECILGIPIACYVFGAVFGNAFRLNTTHVKESGLQRLFTAVHAVPSAAFYGLLALLVVIYVSYFVVMGGYLFSALAGALPADFTYAEYARQGFFELCTVASVNAFLLGVTWLFSKRADHQYPGAIRLLSGLIAFATCLLIVTAASKMLLYIGSYGLTQLRVYTLWFMVFLFVAFLLLVVWHVRPFNAARPIILVATALFLALALTNTNGLIAGYNTDRYLSGQVATVDVDQFYSLGDAGVPSLMELAEDAPDADVRTQAKAVLADKDAIGYNMLYSPEANAVWYNFNLNYARADELRPK